MIPDAGRRRTSRRVRMTLSLATLGPLALFEVVADAEFSTLGFLSMPRPHMLTFVESRGALKPLRAAPRPLSVITCAALAPALSGVSGMAIAADPRRAFFEVHNHLARATGFYGAHEPTCIDPTADVDPTASIAAVGVRIGPRTAIGPHVSIRGRCHIGADVVIHPGAVIGGRGFQLTRFPDRVLDMAHAGGIRIGDRAAIHANAVVASGVFHDDTTIGDDCHVGNLAFVSHSVRIGRRSFIGHLAVVNGGVTIGENAWVGPGSTIRDRVAIGDGARISLGTTIIGDVPAGQQMTGSVGLAHRRCLRHLSDLGARDR